MRRLNYAVIIIIVAALGSLGWWALARFEERYAAGECITRQAEFHWGNTDWRGLGDWPRAAAEYRRVLDEYPETRWAVLAAPMYVSAQMNQGDDTAALAAAEYYAGRYRGSEAEAQLWFLQGQCLKRLGRPAAARAAFCVCREWFPGSRAADAAAAVLATLPPDTAVAGAAGR